MQLVVHRNQMHQGTQILWGVINFVVGVIIALLALRVLFRLFGASSLNSFVRFIYDTSAPLVYPFNGIFPQPSLGVFYTLDIPALIAALVYAIASQLLLSLINAFNGRDTQDEIDEV